ncbi:MAG: hypothetical protein K6G00_03545 [Treponema sp.]|nr:hypothetical protein [Treponema sp.]
MTMKSSNDVSRVFVMVTLLFILTMFLMPMFYGISGSLKSKEQLSSLNLSPVPQSPKKFNYNGKDCDMFLVPLNGEKNHWPL